MKIAKLLSLTPVLVVCLALAVVSMAQIGRARSDKRVLGTVSLRKDGKKKQKVKVFLEANGALSLGDERVEKLCFQDGSVYFPGKSSDQREINIRDGKIRSGNIQTTKIYLYRARATSIVGFDWGQECECLESPRRPGPPPNPPAPLNPGGSVQPPKKTAAIKEN
jgi:hypothetical protein